MRAGLVENARLSSLKAAFASFNPFVDQDKFGAQAMDLRIAKHDPADDTAEDDPMSRTRARRFDDGALWSTSNILDILQICRKWHRLIDSFIDWLLLHDDFLLVFRHSDTD